MTLIGGLGILDTPADPVFDELARRAAETIGAPMASISFLDSRREWFKASHGIVLREWPRALSFYSTRESSARVQSIADFLFDENFSRHPLVEGMPFLRFYAGAAITAGDGEVVGVLAVLGTAPRELGAREAETLANLADLVQARLEARRENHSPQSTFSTSIVANTLEQAHPLLEPSTLDEVVQREMAIERGRQDAKLAPAILDSLPEVFFLLSAHGRIVRWNRYFIEAAGYREEEIPSLHLLDLFAEKDREALTIAMRRVFDDGADATIEANLLSRPGLETPYVFSARPMRDGTETLLIGLGRDISERRRAETQMHQARERYDLALQGSNLALWDWDLITGTAYFNEGWGLLTGMPSDESVARGEEVLSWCHPDDRELFRAAMESAVRGATSDFEAEYRVSNAAGEWIWIASRGKVTQRNYQGRAVRMTGTSSDITKRKQAEERVEFLATRDPLTGLPNRMLLNDRLEQGIASAARNRKRLAFMFIDLDRFKTINDSLGHQVGDELLKQVATRLAACVRATDTVARLGGDEFAVILEDLRDDDSVRHVAENMIASLASPIFSGNLQLNTSCSIGIGLYPGDGRDSTALLKNADVAMYHAKEKGRNNFQFFSADMNAKVIEKLSIENYLRQALRREELLLHYQPRVSFSTGKMVGVEALIRWQHPRRGLVPPEKFIPIAEDAGLIMPIGEWVLETACRQVKAWQKQGAPELKVSVNLSMGQTRDGDGLIRCIDQVLARSGLNARFLELELTESMLMQNIEEKVVLLGRLGERGISLSIDDFGTGYSSLYYLKRLPVDSVKIDGSFVRDIVVDPNDEVIIRAIVAMSHSMRLKVVAEAVENDAQFTSLKALGCDEYQGFHFSPGVAAEEFASRYLGRR